MAEEDSPEIQCEAAATDERLLRILQEFGEAKLPGKYAVSGDLTEEDLALLCLVLEMDKTQQKLKVDRRLQKLAEKANYGPNLARDAIEIQTAGSIDVTKLWNVHAPHMPGCL